MRYKSSKYNIKVDSNRVYNTWHCKYVETECVEELCKPEHIWENPTQKLLQEEFIVPETLDETNTMIEKIEKLRQEEKPKYVQYTICTTMRCNMACDYCFEKNKGNYTLNENQERQIVDFITKEVNSNENLEIMVIRWFGGEPLLNVDSIVRISKELIGLCEEKGIKYAAFMYTNGYLLTEELSKRLYDKCRITRVVISMDGFEERFNRIRHTKEGTLEQVLKNIETAEQYVLCDFHIDRDNTEEIFEFYKYLKERITKENIKFQIHSLRETGNSITLAEFYEYYEKFNKINKTGKTTTKRENKQCLGCFYCQKKNYIFGADGFIYRCDNHLVEKEKAIGTIESGIYENDEITKQFTENIYSRKKECKDCAYLPKCLFTCYDEYLNGKYKCDYSEQLLKLNS